MNILMTVNHRNEAMLIHDEKLGFKPAWVEFAWDKRGIRIIGETGEEYSAGVTVNKEMLDHLDSVNDIVLVWMRDGKPLEGWQVTFVTQYYDRQRKEGASYGGGWSSTDS